MQKGGTIDVGDLICLTKSVELPDFAQHVPDEIFADVAFFQKVTVVKGQLAGGQISPLGFLGEVVFESEAFKEEFFEGQAAIGVVLVSAVEAAEDELIHLGLQLYFQPGHLPVVTGFPGGIEEVADFLHHNAEVVDVVCM